MSPRVLGQVRTTVTLAVLALLLVLGLTRGLAAVAEPFPERADAPVCEETTLGAGDVLRPEQLTVSVVNAGERAGLAAVTIEDLEGQGFARGAIANLGTADVRRVQIWSPDGRTPAVQLLASYLSGKVKVVEREGEEAGITLVVGDQFPGVREGLPQVELTADLTVCSPVVVAP